MPYNRPTLGAIYLVAPLLAAQICIGLPAMAATPESADRRDRRIAALAEAIDHSLAARWEAATVVPADRSDDGEFLRRVYLDLAGKVPPVSVARQFLADKSADKRERMIAKLLRDPTYVANFVAVWRAVLLPELETDVNLRFQSSQFDTWLIRQLAGETRYDEIVRELLTVPLGANLPRAGRRPTDDAASIFYQVKQFKPENVAGAITRALLGIRIECAQCHDHPFAPWKQDDFWAIAAFFGRLPSATQQSVPISPTKKEPTDAAATFDIKIPDTDRTVSARLLGAPKPALATDGDPREILANWVTHENPYFAAAAVNRLWAHLFGTGLVDPVDDFRESNPPSHPELLAHLAAEFEACDFDLKLLLAAMCRSRAYQLTSACSDSSQNNPHMFARAASRAVSPQQLYQSLVELTGFQGNPPPFTQSFQLTSAGGELLDLFGFSGVSATERPLSVLQALSMMNGTLVADATSPVHGALVAAVAGFPLMSTSDRIETLYLATLTRRPTSSELEPLVEYVDSGGSEGDLGFALCDVLWALVNSSEFLVNH